MGGDIIPAADMVVNGGCMAADAGAGMPGCGLVRTPLLHGIALPITLVLGASLLSGVVGVETCDPDLLSLSRPLSLPGVDDLPRGEEACPC